MINIDRFEISTPSSLHGTSHEENPEEACGSEEESEKGSVEERNRKNYTNEEKMLILHHYTSMGYTKQWYALEKIIYEERTDTLTRDMVVHYEYLFKHHKLNDRIKRFIKKVLAGKYDTDSNIKDLVQKAKSIPPVASPKGQR